MKISDVRRENARRVVKENGGVTAISKRLGYRNASFLSQQLGPKPTREVTEKTARAIEAELQLAPGTLDQAPDQPAPTVAASISTELVADVIRMAGSTLESEGVTSVGPEKFASLVALAFADAMEHGGKAREAHVRAIAKLLK